MNAESIEHYPGYSGMSRERCFFFLRCFGFFFFRSSSISPPVLVSYLKNHNTWSYSEFLKLHRDVIVSSPPFSDEWNGLDGTWARRFLNKAKDLSPLTFAAEKKR
ncbi:hypothetical protein BC936DRAFT_138788 [Jimgerdemannia flammicorona]|uniref:Uncharacterized protein n=1 Tax=Jimgerdemannia flammicorona TaxID=994334 RepID=A0A433BJ34_9FUNG|nr:hypothetical protein BC936DRAFT_138788 [Jimgerdemannia flammicorona]